jgi:hypothetical protein
VAAYIKKIRFFRKSDGIIFVDRPIFYLPDGKSIEDYSDDDFQKHAEECKIPEQYKKFELISILGEDKCPPFKDTWQLYLDGGELKHDEEWARQIMPPVTVKRKRIGRIRTLRDDALTAEDFNTVIKYNAELDAIKEKDDHETYVQSLADLIAYSEIDKAAAQNTLEIITATMGDLEAFLVDREYPKIYLKE